MNFHLNDLLLKIENTRMEMISLATQHGYSSPNVIQCSQKLDRLLNTYNKNIGQSFIQ